MRTISGLLVRKPRHYSSTQPWQALTKAKHQMMAIVKRKAASIISRSIMRIFGMVYDWTGVRTRRSRRIKLALTSAIAVAVLALPVLLS